MNSNSKIYRDTPLLKLKFIYRIQRLHYQCAVPTVYVINWTHMAVHGLKSSADAPKAQILAQHPLISVMDTLSPTEIDSIK